VAGGFALGALQLAKQVLQQGEGDDHHGGDRQQRAPVPPVELECHAEDLADAQWAGQCRLARLSDCLAHVPTSRHQTRGSSLRLALGCSAKAHATRSVVAPMLGADKGQSERTARSVVWGRPENQRRPGKAAQVRTGPPLKQAKVAQGGTLTGSLTEQGKPWTESTGAESGAPGGTCWGRVAFGMPEPGGAGGRWRRWRGR